MKKLHLISFLLLCIINAKAGVDLRNGNFYMSYTDIVFKNTNAEVVRNYNSSNSKVGIFGHGWNSFLESSLSALPDGSMTMNWWGNSSGDYYEPALINRKGLYDMVNRIINNLILNNKLDNNPVAIAEKKSFYLINNTERAKKYIELQRSGIENYFIPPADKKITWVLTVNQSITWNGEKYEVKSWNDKYEFNEKGQLTLNNEPSYSMRLFYSNNKISKLLIDEKEICIVETDSSGKITKLSYNNGEEEKMAFFKYDTNNNLIYSKDIGNNEYWYQYDLYHNMVRIGYVDSSFVSMTYDAATNRIISYRNKNGSYNTYQYPYFYSADGKINYNHYATRVKKFDSSSHLIFTQYKEYESRVKADGSTYLYRMLEQTDTSYHEVLYPPEIGNARYRKKNDKEAWATYDSKNRPSYLHINDSIYRSSYNILDLPEYFLAIDSLKNDSTLYTYFYNNDNKLTQVKKNNLTYFITGEMGDSLQEIKKADGNYLIVHYLNNIPHSIENKQWGKLLIDSAPNIEQQNSGKLMELYNEFKDIMAPIHIAHEWIWERM